MRTDSLSQPVKTREGPYPEKGVTAMRKSIQIFLLVLLTGYLSGLMIGCGPTVVVRQPPPKKVEVKPAKPYPNAVWVQGHWAYRGGTYVWVPGHWKKARPGRTWVAGHWARRRGGWVWVKGYWR